MKIYRKFLFVLLFILISTNIYANFHIGGTVSIYGGLIAGNVYGGIVTNGIVGFNNIFMLAGKVEGNLYGGYVEQDGDADFNRISIAGGTVDGNLYGGFVNATQPNENYTTEVMHNDVTIKGSANITGNIYAGYVKRESGTVNVISNSVTLSGSPTFSSTSKIYGGFIEGEATGDVFTGNTLNVHNYKESKGSVVDTIANFEYYNFILDNDVNSGDTILTVNNINFENINASKNSEINAVNIMGGSKVLKDGDSINLIKYTTNIGTIGNDNKTISGKQGISLLYDFILNQTNDSITATVSGSAKLNPETAILSDGIASGMILLNQGADFIANVGIRTAKSITKDKIGIVPFFAIGNGYSSYETELNGSISTFSYLSGIAYNNNFFNLGNLLLGGFFENGYGDYESKKNILSSTLNADGTSMYFGGGALLRFDTTSGVYVESSFRMGATDTSFSSDELVDATGESAYYNFYTPYIGAHAGLGYVYKPTAAIKLDTYAKYFWTKQDDSVVDALGDTIKFDNINSHRLRVGWQFSYDFIFKNMIGLTPYLGLAYEYHFDGKVDATTYGYNIDRVAIAGHQGLAELGLSFNLKGFTFDLALEYDFGTRSSVNGFYQIRYEF